MVSQVGWRWVEVIIRGQVGFSRGPSPSLSAFLFYHSSTYSFRFSFPFPSNPGDPTPKYLEPDERDNRLEGLILSCQFPLITPLSSHLINLYSTSILSSYSHKFSILANLHTPNLITPSFNKLDIFHFTSILTQ
jgi:hypothetical protein